ATRSPRLLGHKSTQVHRRLLGIGNLARLAASSVAPVPPIRNRIGVSALRRKAAYQRRKAPPRECVIPQRFAQIDTVFTQEVSFNQRPVFEDRPCFFDVSPVLGAFAFPTSPSPSSAAGRYMPMIWVKICTICTASMPRSSHCSTRS